MKEGLTVRDASKPGFQERQGARIVVGDPVQVQEGHDDHVVAQQVLRGRKGSQNVQKYECYVHYFDEVGRVHALGGSCHSFR